jgi:hypothetical protein
LQIGVGEYFSWWELRAEVALVNGEFASATGKFKPSDWLRRFPAEDEKSSLRDPGFDWENLSGAPRSGAKAAAYGAGATIATL